MEDIRQLHYSGSLLPIQTSLFHVSPSDLLAPAAWLADIFEQLVKTGGFESSIKDQLQLGDNALTTEFLRAQFIHPTEGLQIIQGSLPPPPPALDEKAAAIAAITAAVTAAVSAAVAGAVASSVAGAAAGAAAGGAAGGAGSASASGGGVAPLIFGVQRFGASAGLATNKSELQAGVSSSMGWASGSFGATGGGSDEEDDVAAAGSRRRLAQWVARALVERQGNTTLGNATQVADDAGSGDAGSGSEAENDEPPPPTHDALVELLDKLVRTHIIVHAIIVHAIIVHAIIVHARSLPPIGSCSFRTRTPCVQFTFGIVFPAIWLIDYLGRLFWKCTANKQYYAEISSAKASGHSLLNIADVSVQLGGETAKPSVPFRPLPGAFVFPNMQTLTLSIFITGLVEVSANLVALPADSCTTCKGPGYLVLLMTVMWLFSAFRRLLHVYGFFDEIWQPADEADDPHDVEDPLSRLLSKIRSRILPPGCAHICFDRERGGFESPEEDCEEPARTERLLANAYALVRPRAGDSLDSLTLLWMNRSSGNCRWLGLYYEWIMMLGQLMISFVSGIGSGITPGSVAADAQVVAVMMIQLGTCFYCIFAGPSSDRIDNYIMVAQYGMEGTTTLLLFIQRFVPAAEDGIQQACFVMALSSMFLPIIEKGYDAFVVQISLIARKEEFSFQSFLLAFLGFLLVLPGLVAGILGFETGDGLAEALLDETIGVSEGLMEAVEELDGLADAVSNLYWTTRPVRARRASNHVAKIYAKRFKARSEAARRIQERAREHHDHKVQAAVKIQAAIRSFHSRMSAIPMITPRQPLRPGFQWLQSQVVRIEHRPGATDNSGRPGYEWLGGQMARAEQLDAPARSFAATVRSRSNSRPTSEVPAHWPPGFAQQRSFIPFNPPVGMPPGFPFIDEDEDRRI